MCENFDSNLSEPGQKYPYISKISPVDLPVSSINYVHINIYIYTSAHTLARSLHDVSRANNNRFAVVFALGWHFMPRNSGNLSKKEIAKIAHVSLATVYNVISRKRTTSSYVTKRCWTTRMSEEFSQAHYWPTN